MSETTVANTVAGISLIFSTVLGIFYLRDRRHAVFAIANDYARELTDWHGAVVEVIMALRSTAKSVGQRGAASDLARLSALIEQGRFYFPNIDRGDEFGAEKPPAYRGYRNLALDFLVGSYNIYSSESTRESLTDAERLQRHFTSIVFEIVRPNGRLEQIRSLTDRYFVLEQCYDDFLSGTDGKTLEHIWRKPS